MLPPNKSSSWRRNQKRQTTFQTNRWRKWVTDKGYHSNEKLVDLQELGIRTYISEPKRGRRNWTDKAAERDAVYANRRRIRGQRGKQLLRQRGLMLERPFAHCYETGGMRRLHLRGRDNILKRLLVHVAGFNLSLVLRLMIGKGTPRGLQDLVAAYFIVVFVLVNRIKTALEGEKSLQRVFGSELALFRAQKLKIRNLPSATGC